MPHTAVRALDGFSGRTTTDDVIIGLVQRFSRLRCIDLEECERLTDAAITAVADKCPKLASLDVGCCGNLTDAAITAVADKCPPRFAECRVLLRLADAAIRTFEERRPGVRIDTR